MALATSVGLPPPTATMPSHPDARYRRALGHFEILGVGGEAREEHRLQADRPQVIDGLVHPAGIDHPARR